MGKDKSQTTGHKYFLGLHTVLCQKVDYISKIVIGEKDAWEGRAVDAQIRIDKPDLFGGKESGGGWTGAVDVLSGSATQAQNEYLKTLLGSDPVPAFRGVASMVWRKNYIGNAPFLKPIEVKATAIRHGVGDWLPDLAAVPALANGASDGESGMIYIAIDASYSMFVFPFERITYAKTAVTDALEALKGGAPSIRIVTFGEDTEALDAVEYFDATDAEIDTMIAWVDAIAYSGTAGEDVAAGSDWEGAVASAPAFFGTTDPAAGSQETAGDVFLSSEDAYFQDISTFGAINEAVTGSRSIIIVTDGAARPSSSPTTAAATIDTISSVAAYVFNVGLTDTTAGATVQNVPGDVPVTGPGEVDLSVDTADASVGPNTSATPVKMLGRWSLGRFSGIWPTTNYNNISLDPFSDPTTVDNANTVTAMLWVDISAYPDGSTIYYQDTLQVTGDSGTAIHAYPNYLWLSTITQAEYDANSAGNLQVQQNTTYLGSATVNNSIEREYSITKEAGDTYLRVELRFSGCHAVGKVTRQTVIGPTISLSGSEQGDLTAAIGRALGDHQDRNPAHILRDLIIAPWYGGDGDTTQIGDSFATAAQTLYDEGFGLTMLNETPSDKLAIKRQIERHIGGHIFESRTTGKWEIKLIRDDYDVGNLTTFDGSLISGIVKAERPMQEELPNQVTVTWTKREDGKSSSLTAHNTAAIQARGYIVPVTEDMPGISYEGLASRVLSRELLSQTVPLWRGQFRALYLPSGHDLGSAIIVDDPRIGMNSVVCRITEIDFGNGTENEVTISFVEDLFSLGLEAIVATDTVTGADTSPQAATYRIVEEAPYYVAARTIGESEIEQRLTDDPDAGYLMATCEQPNGYHVNAWIAKSNGTNWYQDGTCDFAPTVFLNAAIDGDADSLTLTTNVSEKLYGITSRDLIMIDAEIMRIDDLSVAGDVATITVGRGCLDTVPVRHEAGAAVQFWYEAIGTDGDQFTSGQSVGYRLLPRTPSESLPPASATTDTVTFASRAIRPLPPGNFQIEAAYSLTGVQTGDLDGTWNHRDRLTQTTATPEDYADGDVGPEASVSYTPQRRMLETLGDIFDNSDTFDTPDIFAITTRRGPYDYASTTGKTHTFSADDADMFDATDIFDLSDVFEDAFDPATVGIELGVKSVRGGYDNWQTKWVRVDPLLPPINLTATEV